MGLLSKVGTSVGRTFRTKKLGSASQVREIRLNDPSPTSLYAVEDFPVISYSGWTVQEVQAALNESESGQLGQTSLLLAAMMRDPVFYHGVMTRIMAFLSTGFKLKRTKQFPQEVYQALLGEWKHILSNDTLASLMKFRMTCGVAPADIHWYVKGDYWFPKIVAKHPGNLSYNLLEGRYYYVGRDGRYPVIPDGREWLLFQGLGEVAPYLDGSIRSLAMIWYTKQEAIRLWRQYSRVHGNAIRKVKVPGSQRETEDVRALVKRAQELIGGSVFTAPQYADGLSYDLELVEARGNSYLTFVDLIALCDKYITLDLLGAIDNTQSMPYGSRAKAEVAEKQTNKYLASDCQVMAHPLEPLLERFCEYNRLDARHAPIAYYEYLSLEDEAEKAKTAELRATALQKAAAGLEKLTSQGIQYDIGHVLSQCGIELNNTAIDEDKL